MHGMSRDDMPLSLSGGDAFAAVELLSAWGGDDQVVKIKAVGPEGWGAESKWVNVPGWLLRKIVVLVNEELGGKSGS
jgi:hypothetical protein